MYISIAMVLLIINNHVQLLKSRLLIAYKSVLFFNYSENGAATTIVTTVATI